MGQLPRPLTPHVSALHFFGAELRRCRCAAGLSQAELGRRTNYSAALIGKIEKADRAPGTAFAVACDRALATGGVFGRLIQLLDQEHCQREPERSVVSSSAPAVVADIEPIRSAIAVFGRIDQQYGGGYLGRMIVDYLDREVVTLVKASPSPAVLAAAAVVARKAGLAALDGRRPERAGRFLDQAVEWARLADNRVVLANVLVTLAHYHLATGRPDIARDLAVASMGSGAGCVPSSLRAKIHMMQARALARLGERRPCEWLMIQADTAFARSTAATRVDLDGISAVEWPYLIGQMARCYADLGLADRAITAAADAASAYPAWQVRRRVMNAAIWSTNLVAAGRLEEAIAVGHQALTAAAGLRSSRGFDEIRRLEGAVAPYRGQQVVREFLDRAQQLATT